MDIPKLFSNLSPNQFAFGMIMVMAAIAPGFLGMVLLRPELLSNGSVLVMIFVASSLTLPVVLANTVIMAVAAGRRGTDSADLPVHMTIAAYIVVASALAAFLAMFLCSADRIATNGISAGSDIKRLVYTFLGLNCLLLFAVSVAFFRGLRVIKANDGG